jgi:hypothetical protein
MTCFALSRVVHPISNSNAEKPKLGLGMRKPPTPVMVDDDPRHLSDETILEVKENAAPTPPEPASKPACSPMPFVHIDGAVYPGEPSWTDPKGRNAAFNRWVWVISKEVATLVAPAPVQPGQDGLSGSLPGLPRPYQTKTKQDAAAEFVRRHRLSIANAFERRIVRADVVAELARLFELETRNGKAP